MTTTIITDQPVVHEYVATAGQDDFDFDFQIFNGSEDITVTVDGVETGAFTVTLVGDEGGYITLSTPCTGGEDVVLLRRIDRKRITMFGNAGPVAMASVDQELNRIVGLIQDLAYDFDELVLALGYTDADAINAIGNALVAGTNITITPTANDITINGKSDEDIRDLVAGFLTAGVGIVLTHNDGADTFTIEASGGGGGGGLTTEDVRDVIGTTLVAGSGITVTVDDPGNTVTIVATGAYTDEQARDAIGAALVAGTGVSISVNDGANTITVSQNPNKTLQIPIMAAALKNRTTSGAAAGTIETTTNKVCIDVMDFDASTDEFAQFALAMPKQWDESTVTVQFIWTVASGSGNVVWGAQAVALSDDDALDSAFGSAVTVTDGVTAAGDVMISSFTGAMTIAGSPAPEDLVVFEFYRDADNGADTLAVDARLIAVRIKVGITSHDDA